MMYRLVSTLLVAVMLSGCVTVSTRARSTGPNSYRCSPTWAPAADGVLGGVALLTGVALLWTDDGSSGFLGVSPQGEAGLWTMGAGFGYLTVSGIAWYVNDACIEKMGKRRSSYWHAGQK